MKYIEEALKTPVSGEYDVIVAGGGPAGVAAAIAAAREGAKTLLVEQYGCLGGMWTTGMVIPIWDWENKGGIMLEIVEALKREGKTAYSGPLLGFDIEAMKLLLDRMCLQSGVELLLHTWFASSIVEQGAVKGIIVENKSGRRAYLADCIIDCTGDGDVAARAGCEFWLGREKDSATQPMSLMFKIGEMDYVQSMDYSPVPAATTELFYHMRHAADKAGLKDYDFNFDRPYILALPTPHQGIAEMTHIRGKDATDAGNLTEAEVEGRELVDEAMRFFVKYMPQFRHAHLDQTASAIGIRESRRIKGRYVLSLSDILSGKRQPDGICVCAFAVDIHQPDGISQEGMELAAKPYSIPFGALVPVGIENLLVAGRCISGTYEAHASYRVTGDCVAMGQAAGTAAALCAEQKIPVSQIDAKRLRTALKKNGVRVDG